MKIRSMLGIVLAASLASQRTSYAQVKPAFEVASVRKHEFTGGRSGGAGRGGGNKALVSRTPERITFQAMPVGQIIAFAYSFPAERMEGWPQWIFDDVYDVAATTAAPTSLSDQKLMLQELLGERFGLVVHRTSKEGPVYALVAGKKVNLIETKEADSVDVPQFAGRLVSQQSSMSMVYTGKHVSMGDLASWLSAGVGRPVVNKTGIEGLFDIEIDGPGIEAVKGASVGGPDQLIPAVRNQLGLNLESERGVVETLVIDRVGKPGEN